MNKRWLFFLIALSFVFSFTKLSAFNTDTTKTVDVPKHYFSKTIYADLYSLGKRELDTTNTISKKLKSYKLGQFTLGFNFPVITKNFYNKDSTRISNFHFLFAGNLSRINVSFGGITDHQLSKASLGFRGIYNNGKRSIFYIEFSPFVTKDKGYAYTRTYRLASTFLYDCSVNQYFSLRLGVTRSFSWGNRFYLPYIGIRVGRLDKVNFSIQFPRSITFNVPMGRYIRTSLFTKPQGGFYAFANTDSIQTRSVFYNRKLLFGRNEFLSGLRIDILPSKYFNLYLSGGIITNNHIAFYPLTKSDELRPYRSYYKEKLKGSIFVNFGLVIRFGKTRSFYNSTQLYEAMDLNNTTGNDGTMPGDGNIPRPPKKMPKVSTDEVLDLIEAQDVY